VLSAEGIFTLLIRDLPLEGLTSRLSRVAETELIRLSPATWILRSRLIIDWRSDPTLDLPPTPGRSFYTLRYKESKQQAHSKKPYGRLDLGTRAAHWP
jgi:hypothetical protein